MINNSPDMFGDSSGSATPSYGGSVIGSQPSQPMEIPDSSGDAADEDQDIFELSLEDDINQFCSRCNKKFKTKGGFKRHKFLHIYKDALLRVSVKTLRENSSSSAEEVLIEMLSDEVPDSCREDRTKVIETILSNICSKDWLQFLNFITSNFLDILLKKNTRVLPAKQYEENLFYFNEFMCNEVTRKELLNLLKDVTGSNNTFVLNNVVYRFCNIFFKNLKVSCLKMMQSKMPVLETRKDLNKQEKQTLYYASGSIVRRFIRKGTKADKCSKWQFRVRFIKERLLYVEGETYSEEFNEIKEWYDRVDRGGLTATNEMFFKFLLEIELIVRDVVKEDFSSIRDEVINRLFSVDNPHILQIWYDLSSTLPEVESVFFCDLIVQQYVKFSASAEAALKLRTTSKKHKRKVALRTGFKKD